MKKEVVYLAFIVIATSTLMAFTNEFESSRKQNLMLALLDTNIEALSEGDCQIYYNGKAMCKKAPGKKCGFKYKGGNWYCTDMQLFSKD